MTEEYIEAQHTQVHQATEGVRQALPVHVSALPVKDSAHKFQDISSSDDHKLIHCRLRKALTGDVWCEWDVECEVANGKYTLSDDAWVALERSVEKEAAAALGVPRAWIKLAITTEGESITFQAVRTRAPTEEELDDLQTKFGVCALCGDPVGKAGPFACSCAWGSPEEDLCELCRVYLPDGSHRCLGCFSEEEKEKHRLILSDCQLSRMNVLELFWRSCDEGIPAGFSLQPGG